MLAEVFAGTTKDTTEENIQARCRGVILMALSNKQGKLLLTTGNKSEMSVGYATLYGDMAAVLRPSRMYPSCWFINWPIIAIPCQRSSLSGLLPARLSRISAWAGWCRLLTPYEVLDPILERYVELDQSAEEIIAAGFRREDVARAINLVDRNEYKRRQSPPGIRITTRAFGRDRRYPITSGYRGI